MKNLCSIGIFDSFQSVFLIFQDANRAKPQFGRDYSNPLDHPATTMRGADVADDTILLEFFHIGSYLCSCR